MSEPIQAPPAEIILRSPSKYVATSSPPPSFVPPPLDWLLRTWAVTHSTLSMWRGARNLRITYSCLQPRAGDGAARVDDLVEYEAGGKLKSVAGIDTASSSPFSGADWDWRGKGWLLCFITSHWEVLGWGEREVPGGAGRERWVVTWFAPTLFTREGVDIYCDRPEGLSGPTAEALLAALGGLEAGEVAELVEKDMREVEVKLPWMHQ